MRRQLTAHKIHPTNDTLTIEVLDEPGPGGANHAYSVAGLNEYANPFFRTESGETSPEWTDEKFIVFQNGAIGEVGVNGITHEALLAILIDRLESFQKGPFPSPENSLALHHLQQALDWLSQRTRRRMMQGVEGTMAPCQPSSSGASGGVASASSRPQVDLAGRSPANSDATTPPSPGSSQRDQEPSPPGAEDGPQADTPNETSPSSSSTDPISSPDAPSDSPPSTG